MTSHPYLVLHGDATRNAYALRGQAIGYPHQPQARVHFDDSPPLQPNMSFLDPLHARVHFDENIREHIIFSEAPPSMRVARYRDDAQPPMASGSALSHVDAIQSTSRRESESSRDGRPSYSPPSHGIGARTAPPQTPTPVNSPQSRATPISSSAYGAVIPPKSLSPSPPLSPSPSPSPEPASDLSGYLQSPFQWDVRAHTWSEGAPDYALKAQAFTSGKKSCTVHFVTPDGSDNWTIAVGPSGHDVRPLTVADVLKAVGENLYEVLEDTALCPGMVRYSSAKAERPYRLHGEDDSRREVDVLRNIDFFPQGASFFRGLMEESGEGRTVQYRVLIGPRK
ncbi:hypothetical protein C8Q80DRAFT_343569 [Daedaleopsis nitida]|nr:hypothetical protein C8Q80DRAFT_343569 [Daedaleopsis nitida]